MTSQNTCCEECAYDGDLHPDSRGIPDPYTAGCSNEECPCHLPPSISDVERALLEKDYLAGRADGLGYSNKRCEEDIEIHLRLLFQAWKMRELASRNPQQEFRSAEAHERAVNDRYSLIKSFILSSNRASYEKGQADEAERWLHQPANEHDEKIRGAVISMVVSKISEMERDYQGKQAYDALSDLRAELLKELE